VIDAEADPHAVGDEMAVESRHASRRQSPYPTGLSEGGWRESGHCGVLILAHSSPAEGAGYAERG
jgi:hypothetical protein